MPGLRDILEAATHEDWRVRSEAYSRLFALAPELAALCLDLADLVSKTIYEPPGYSGPRAWWGEEADALLARLDQLGKEQTDG